MSSGLIIQQDIRTAARFVFFDTGEDAWRYATHGGTLFVVLYDGRPYGLTCRHVIGDFRWQQLVVTDERFGSKIAGLRSIYYPSNPTAEAVGTDIVDVAVIQFSDDVDAAFFNGTAYLLDTATVATARSGDTLHIAGTLKSKSKITEDALAPVFCFLEMMDDTTVGADPTLRRAIGKFEKPEFADVIGLSGSPVFNASLKALSGVVVRGGMVNDLATLFYIDIFDVMHVLSAASSGLSETFYRKQVAVPKGVAPH